jgi:hypothetical protein
MMAHHFMRYVAAAAVVFMLWIGIPLAVTWAHCSLPPGWDYPWTLPELLTSAAADPDARLDRVLRGRSWSSWRP